MTIDSYAGVKSNDEKALMEAVAAQPVSVGICGSERAFQLYSKVSWMIRDTPTPFSGCSTFPCLKILSFDAGNILWPMFNIIGSRCAHSRIWFTEWC